MSSSAGAALAFARGPHRGCWDSALPQLGSGPSDVRLLYSHRPLARGASSRAVCPPHSPLARCALRWNGPDTAAEPPLAQGPPQVQGVLAPNASTTATSSTEALRQDAPSHAVNFKYDGGTLPGKALGRLRCPEPACASQQVRGASHNGPGLHGQGLQLCRPCVPKGELRAHILTCSLHCPSYWCWAVRRAPSAERSEAAARDLDPELSRGNGARARNTGSGPVEVSATGGEDGAQVQGYRILHLSAEGGPAHHAMLWVCKQSCTRLGPCWGLFDVGIPLAERWLSCPPARIQRLSRGIPTLVL